SFARLPPPLGASRSDDSREGGELELEEVGDLEEAGELLELLERQGDAGAGALERAEGHHLASSERPSELERPREGIAPPEQAAAVEAGRAPMARGVRPTPPARERRAAVLAAGRSAALELDAGELLELLEPLELELDAGELLELLEPLELEADGGELLELLELLELFEPLELELDAGELLELLELAGCALPCARVSARSAAVLLDAGRASAAATGVDRVDAHRYALHDQGLSAMHRHE